MKKRSELYVLGPTQPCPDASTSVMILPSTRDRLVPTNNYGVCYDLLPCSLCAVRTIQKQSRDTRAPKEIGVFVGDLNPKLSWVRFVVCAIRCGVVVFLFPLGMTCLAIVANQSTTSQLDTKHAQTHTHRQRMMPKQTTHKTWLLLVVCLHSFLIRNHHSGALA